MINAIEEYLNASPGLRDSIKTLRSNIEFSSIDEGIKTLAVISALSDEGKSTIAIYLAIAMAESGKRTLLVETDCRKPRLRARLMLRPQRSWLDLIYGNLDSDADINATVMATRQENLFLLDCAPQIVNPVELISSKKFAHLIGRLKECYDFVIFDTPPSMAFIDSAIIASNVDGTIIVMAPGKVDFKIGQDIIKQLKKANAKIIGAVLNQVKPSKMQYYDDYYGETGSQKKNKKKRDKN